MIANKIKKEKKKFKKQDPEQFYANNWYILFEVNVWDNSGLLLFNSECFSQNKLLKQWIPLLFWENWKPKSTQCWPTVTWIQQKILWNTKDALLTVDNPQDPGIMQKSVRWQALLDQFYDKESSFLTPIDIGKNTLISPICKSDELSYQNY